MTLKLEGSGNVMRFVASPYLHSMTTVFVDGGVTIVAGDWIGLLRAKIVCQRDRCGSGV